MPTDKSSDVLPGKLYIMGEDGASIEIGELGPLTLDQEQDPDPVWENFRENMEFTITADLGPVWYMRLVYLFGKRKQRKTALEKRKRRERHEDIRGNASRLRKHNARPMVR